MATSENPIKPLLRRTSLLPGESLASLVARLVSLNHYTSPFTIMLLVEPKLSGALNYKQEIWDNLDRPYREKTYERLAALTKLSPLELYQATEHTIATIAMPPDAELETISLPNGSSDLQAVPLIGNRHAHVHFYKPSNAQYCPICLKEDDTPYHRLLWSARMITACRRHEVLLLNQCTECASDVRVRDIAAGYCQRCNAELAGASVTSIAGDQLGLLAQALIAALISGSQSPSDTQEWAIPQQPPRVLYRLVQGLASAVRLANADWDFLHRFPGCSTGITASTTGRLTVSTDEMYRIYATACKALIDWPSNFFHFLSDYRTQKRSTGNQSTYMGALITDLGTFYVKWLMTEWRTEEFTFVQEAFDSFIATDPMRSGGAFRAVGSQSIARKERLGFMSVSEAAAALRLHRDAVIKLIDNGYLYADTGRLSDTHSFHLIRKTDVRSLATQWEEGGWLSSHETAHLLGINWTSLRSFIKAGLLVPVHGPTFDGFPVWVYSRSTVSACLSRLAGKLTSLPANTDMKGMIGSNRAGNIVGAGRGGKETLLGLVESGQLRGYLYSTQPSRLPYLYFNEADIRAHFGVGHRWDRYATSP